MSENQKMILGKSKSNNLFNETIAQQKQKQSQIPVMGKTKAVGDMRNPTVAKNINKKIEESEIAKSAKQSTAANMQNSSAGQAQKECSNFCRKKASIFYLYDTPLLKIIHLLYLQPWVKMSKIFS